MKLMMSGSKEVSAFPEEDNVFQWAGSIKGTQGTAYEGMTFKLRLVFPADYPFTAPKVTFVTPCWHPNVDTAGNICLDILKCVGISLEPLSLPHTQPYPHARQHLTHPPLLFFLCYRDKWTAAYSALTVLLSIQTLLGDPNNDSPLNGQAATGWADQAEFRRTTVKKYREATGGNPTSGPLDG